MTTKEIKDELYRMLSDVVNGGYPKRTYAQQARYKEAVKRTVDALDILDEMSNSEKPNEWIPISKEVPKERGYYLTTTMFGEVYCDFWDEIAFDRTETVIAWMPLPKPYKAESEGTE